MRYKNREKSHRFLRKYLATQMSRRRFMVANMAIKNKQRMVDVNN